VTEEVDIAGTVGFMALHGGIEAGTADLARRAAGASNSSLYVVEVPDDLWWHVPSTEFDPAASSGLDRFLTHVDRVISLHGFGRPGVERTVLLGGSNRPMATRVATVMRRHSHWQVVDDLASIPRTLRGLHPRNPVNLPAQAGVQAEMTADLREGIQADLLMQALLDAAVQESRLRDTG
ncbi:MAG: poly-gamma-glutamate hydrolase family protein, partial [Acidimicrobiia bacterium]|nr:poly-gamma-glutamate hydrolase family protein [Acidimicrobiia bacterium]